MAQYIDKSALVAEIRKRLLPVIRDKHYDEFEEGQDSERIAILDIINTLEVKELPIWEKVSPDTGQTTLYKDEDKSYLERFGYRIDLKELDKLPKKNLKARKEKRYDK